MNINPKEIAATQIRTQENFIFNLNYLLDQHKISQKKLSELTNTAESTISGYCGKTKMTTMPKIEFLIILQSLFNVSVDDLLNRRLNETETNITFKSISESDSKIFDKYLGAYYMYYFNTNSENINGYSLRGELSYGIMFLYKVSNNSGYNNYRAIALFGLERDRMKSVLNALKLNDYNTTIFINVLKTEVIGKEHVYVYEGTYDVLSRSLTIDLECSSKDKSLTIFKRPDSNKEYIGGLGSSNSLSRGGIQNPCMQYVGISKGLLECEDTVIANYLLLNDSESSALPSTNDVIQRLKEFMKNSSGLGSMLSVEEQDVIIKHHIDHVVKSIVRKSVSRYIKMSHDKEISWYKFIKEFNRDLRGN
jgi:transcriptional regulator with XRE-family HTH domain